MRAAKVLAIVGITALTVGVFTGVALAGKKKKTSVVFFNGSPKFNKGGKVTAKGSINTASACEPGRSMRLQVLDSNGVVLVCAEAYGPAGARRRIEATIGRVAPGGVRLLVWRDER